jgi:hypothetical protein
VFYIGKGQAKEEGGLKTERFEKEHARAGAGLLYFLLVRVKQKENCVCVCVCLFYSRAKQGRRRLEGQKMVIMRGGMLGRLLVLCFHVPNTVRERERRTFFKTG